MFSGMASSKQKWILGWLSLSEVKMATKPPAKFYLLTELSLSRHIFPSHKISLHILSTIYCRE